MRKIRAILILSSLIFTQQVMADTGVLISTTAGKPCEIIVKACLAGGFTRDETPGKRLWEDCLKPALLSQPIDSITIDPAVAKACRTQKIEALKKELQDLQQVQQSGQ